MSPNLSLRPLAQHLRLIGCVTLSIALTACGGGGGSPGTNDSGTRNDGGSGGGGTPTVTVEPSMKLAVHDASGTQVTSLTGGQVGEVRATFLDAQGAPVVGAKVTFAIDPLLVFDPLGTTTATTNAQGVAIIRVKPASISSDGGANIAATAVVPDGVSKGKEASVTVPLKVVPVLDSLINSKGLPIQRSLSISADLLNVEGWNYDGLESKVTVRLADQYSNRVPDGTVVNILAEGGGIGSPLHKGCITVDGACTVSLVTQDFRPLNGRVSVLAYVEGVENFVDLDGDGQYSCTNFVDAKGAVPAKFRPLIDTCVSGGEPFTDQGDPFLDAGKLGAMTMNDAHGLDGQYNAANGDMPVPYKKAAYSAVGDGKWGLNYISGTIEITFSSGSADLTRMVCTTTGCRDWRSSDGDPWTVRGLSGQGCSPQTVYFRLHDENNNPLPARTKLSTDTDGVQVVGLGDEIPSTNAVGGSWHGVTVRPNEECKASSFSIVTESPTLKRVTRHTFISAP